MPHPCLTYSGISIHNLCVCLYLLRYFMLFFLKNRTEDLLVTRSYQVLLKPSVSNRRAYCYHLVSFSLFQRKTLLSLFGFFFPIIIKIFRFQRTTLFFLHILLYYYFFSLTIVLHARSWKLLDRFLRNFVINRTFLPFIITYTTSRF